MQMSKNNLDDELFLRNGWPANDIKVLQYLFCLESKTTVFFTVNYGKTKLEFTFQIS